MNKEEIQNFSKEIEILAKNKSIPYMDAIILHCEISGLEVEIAARLISASLKSKIKKEAENLNFLPKSKNSKLPV